MNSDRSSVVSRVSSQGFIRTENPALLKLLRENTGEVNSSLLTDRRTDRRTSSPHTSIVNPTQANIQHSPNSHPNPVTSSRIEYILHNHNKSRLSESFNRGRTLPKDNPASRSPHNQAESHSQYVNHPSTLHPGNHPPHSPFVDSSVHASHTNSQFDIVRKSSLSQSNAVHFSPRTDIPRSDSPFDHGDRSKNSSRNKSAKFASGTQSPSAEHPDRQVTPWPEPIDSLEVSQSPRDRSPENNTRRYSAQDIERDSLEINNVNEQLKDNVDIRDSPVDWHDRKEEVDRDKTLTPNSYRDNRDKTPSPNSYQVDRERTPVHSENRHLASRENSNIAQTPVKFERNTSSLRQETPQQDFRSERFPTPQQSRSSPQSRQNHTDSRNQSRQGNSPHTRHENSASSPKNQNRRDSSPRDTTPVPQPRGSRRPSETRDPPQKVNSARSDPWASPPQSPAHNNVNETPDFKTKSANSDKTPNKDIQRVYVDTPTFSRQEEEEFRFVKSRLDDPDSLQNTLDRDYKMEPQEHQAPRHKQDDRYNDENREWRSRDRNNQANRRDSQKDQDLRQYDRQRRRSSERYEERSDEQRRRNSERYEERKNDYPKERSRERDQKRGNDYPRERSRERDRSRVNDDRYSGKDRRNDKERYEDNERYNNRRNDRDYDYRDNDRHRSRDREHYRDERDDYDMKRFDRSPPRYEQQNSGGHRNNSHERRRNRDRNHDRDYDARHYPNRYDDRSPPRRDRHRQDNFRDEDAEDNDRYSRHDDRYEPRAIRGLPMDQRYDSGEEADLRREAAYQHQLKHRIERNEKDNDRAVIRMPRTEEDSHDFARDSLEEPYDKRYVDESVPNGYSDFKNSNWESPPQNPFVNKQNRHYSSRESNGGIIDPYDKENYNPYRNDSYRVDSFESYNGQYDAVYDRNFQERTKQPKRGGTPRYYGMPEKTPDHFDPEDAARMELAHPPEPRVNYVEKNKHDYGFVNRKTYREIKDIELEERERLDKIFIDVNRKKNKSNVKQPAKTKSGPPGFRHNSEFSHLRSPDQHKPSSAEELWMQKASNLSTVKDNKIKGKKPPLSGQFNKQPNNSGRRYVKNPSPKAHHLEPLNQRSTVPVQPKYYDDYTNYNNSQSVSPTRRPVELNPISQEIVTEDGQRISFDINLKLLSPQPGQQNVEAKMVQPKSYAGNEVAVYNPNYYDQPEHLSPRRVNNESPSHNSLSSYTKVPPITAVDTYEEPYEDPEDGYAAQFRKARQGEKKPINYKVYTIKDYKKMIKEVQAGQGKLGPDLDTDSYRDKVEKRQKQVEYARLANEKNKAELAHQRTVLPRNNETEEKKKRRAAIEYAKHVPKPQVKPQPNPYNSYEMAAQFSPGRKKGRGSPPQHRGNSKTSTVAVADLDKLQQRHEQDKQAVAAIRQNMEPVSQRA